MESSAPHRVPVGVLYAAIAAMSLWAALYQVPFTRDYARIIFAPETVASIPFSAYWPSQGIYTTEPDIAERASPPVALGDRLVEIDGAPYRHRPDVDRRVALKGPSGALDVVVERRDEAGGTATIASHVTLRPLTLGSEALPLRLVLLVLGMFMPLLCAALGFWVVLARPRDYVAWLVLFMLLSLAQSTEIPREVHYAWPAWARIPGAFYQAFFASTWMIWLPLFGIHFAERLPAERRLWWVPWLVLGPLALFAANAVVSAVASALDARWIAPFAAALDRFRPLKFGLGMVAVGSFFFFMGWKVGVASTPAIRRRMLLPWAGATLGFTPMLIVILVYFATGKKLESQPAALTIPALLALAIFPMTLAYAILVERAIDVRVAVRQGLRYAATRGAIGMAVGLVMLAVAWNVWSLVNDPAANRPRKLMAISILVMAAFLLRRGAQKLFSWTDRRFFREAYDTERVLTGLTEEVRTIVETDPLVDTVLERIGTTLHVEKLAVYLREGDGFVPSRFRGYAALPEVAVTPIVENLRAIAAAGKAFRVRHDDPDSPIRRGALQEPVRKLLDALEAELVLPLLGKRDLLGFVTLGPKKSEEPYSASDVKLLMSVATQTGLSLENSRLTAAVAHEIGRRERMSREIEIAREVQSKLFPQRIPTLEGVDCAGACRPAQAVGGDYYDFLALPGGRLGIALGDVAGKGIPAALLMASLQASLRGQRLSGPADLAHMVTNLNRLIFDSSPDNRYATFFYGEFDVAARRLDYVNAGHNAPMIFRAGGAGVDRLRASGPVIGLVDGGTYEQRSVALAPGDLLVIFSDGISEAMNPAEEEWGEQRLAAAVTANGRPSADTLITSMFAAADRFASGATQHDDMTLVVVRVDG